MQEKNIHFIFEVSLLLKGFNAAAEIIGGIFVWTISRAFLAKTVLFLTQSELSEDPNDKIANFIINAAQQFSVSSQHFIAFYLLSHGILKIILVAGLLKDKLWAYPASLVVFSLFIVYQVHRFLYTHSLWLVVLTIFDLVVLWLVWHEYNYLKVKTTVEA
jgi:uncharacterized membrane protein